MSKSVYSEINLHITWHTKNNNPVLTDSIEQRVHHYLEHETRKTKNAFFTRSTERKIISILLPLCRQLF